VPPEHAGPIHIRMLLAAAAVLAAVRGDLSRTHGRPEECTAVAGVANNLMTGVVLTGTPVTAAFLPPAATP